MVGRITHLASGSDLLAAGYIEGHEEGDFALRLLGFTLPSSSGILLLVLEPDLKDSNIY